MRKRSAPSTLAPAPSPEMVERVPAQVAGRLLSHIERSAVLGFSASGDLVRCTESAEHTLGLDFSTAARPWSFARLHGDLLARELFGDLPHSLPTLREGTTLLLHRKTDSGIDRSFEVIFSAAAPSDDVAWWALYLDASHVPASPDRRGVPPPQRPAEDSSPLRDLLLNTIETLHNGLCLLEMEQNRIVFVNEAFVSITGFSRLELMGSNFECVLAEWPAWRQVLIPHIEDLKNRGRSAGSGHWQVELPAGTKTLEVYGQPIVAGAARARFLLMIVEDITERQQLSNQLVQSEKLAAIGQLAAGLAHEIRSPLAAIYNALYDLDQVIEHKTVDVAEDLDIATEEIKRVQEIINNLLDFARESGSPGGTVDVNEAIKRTLRVISKDFQNSRIDIRTVLGDVPHARISTNALKQILINLCTNAAHAMAGGGTLTIRTEAREGPVPINAINHKAGTHVPNMSYGDDQRDRRRLELSASALQHVVITVTDTGCGISPEVVPMIFNPFFTTKPPGAGTGLGLSVVHAQVRDHGGLIAVESKPGRGTTFTLRLPAEAPESGDDP